MSERGFLLQPTYELRGGVPVVQLYGRLESGASFLIEDDRFRPYFHASLDAEALARAFPKAKCSKSESRDLRGNSLLRIELDLPGRVPELRDRLRMHNLPVYEADVRFAYLYMIDHGLRASIEIDGESEARGRHGLRFFRNPELRASDVRPELSVLSIDIETSPDARQLYSAAIACAGVEEVHIVYKRDVAGAVAYPTERALLAGVAQRIRELDPDVITGWNVVDFDLRVLDRRADEVRVRFQIGRSERPMRFQADRGFTRQSRVDVPGRQVLDGIALVRDASITLDDYRLETAAQELLGRGKLIHGDGADRSGEITRRYLDDPEALVAYNLEDARLVLDILEKEALVDLAVERSMLTGMQLDRVGASIASFDLVYLPELRRRGRVAPSVDQERKEARLRGGSVLDSNPGLFSNVAVFDFKSLYPSLMRTFNLDPLAHGEGADDPDPIVAPNDARFSRRDAILPEILERFGEARARAKERKDKHAEYAVKILMNSFYGVLGAGSCRFFEPDIANAITGFGQLVLGWTRDAFEAHGTPVLYGDTDSVFVSVEPDATPERARERADELRALVQETIAKRIRDEYKVEPRLELELERVYERFFQPTVRGGTQGSKKRYAGRVDGAVQVVGLEAVRRDWPRIAKRLQLGMLERMFNGEPVVPFVRELLDDLRAGKHREELVIRKGLRKGSAEKYTQRTPPHVEAARRSGDPNLRIVHYVMTRRGPEPVAPGTAVPEDIELEHYIDKVMRPVAEAILPHVDSSWDEVLGRPRQLSLL